MEYKDLKENSYLEKESILIDFKRKEKTPALSFYYLLLFLLLYM